MFLRGVEALRSVSGRSGGAAGARQAGRAEETLVFWPGGVRPAEFGWLEEEGQKNEEGPGRALPAGSCALERTPPLAVLPRARAEPQRERSPRAGGSGRTEALPALRLALGSSGECPRGLPRTRVVYRPAFCDAVKSRARS